MWEVRRLLSAFIPRVQNCSEELNAQAACNALFGLHGLGDSEVVRQIVRALLGKVQQCCEELHEHDNCEPGCKELHETECGDVCFASLCAGFCALCFAVKCMDQCASCSAARLTLCHHGQRLRSKLTSAYDVTLSR